MHTSRRSIEVSGTGTIVSRDHIQNGRKLVQNAIALLVIGASSLSRHQVIVTVYPSLQWQRPESQKLLIQNPFISALPCLLPFASIVPSPAICSHPPEPDDIGPGLEALHQSNCPPDDLSAFSKHCCAEKPSSFLPFLLLSMILDSILDRKHPHSTFDHGTSRQDQAGWRDRERVVKVNLQLYCELSCRSGPWIGVEGTHLRHLQHPRQWISKKRTVPKVGLTAHYIVSEFRSSRIISTEDRSLDVLLSLILETSSVRHRTSDSSDEVPLQNSYPSLFRPKEEEPVMPPPPLPVLRLQPAKFSTPGSTGGDQSTNPPPSQSPSSRSPSRTSQVSGRSVKGKRRVVTGEDDDDDYEEGEGEGGRRRRKFGKKTTMACHFCRSEFAFTVCNPLSPLARRNGSTLELTQFVSFPSVGHTLALQALRYFSHALGIHIMLPEWI